jgi:hypothetical protein
MKVAYWFHLRFSCDDTCIHDASPDPGLCSLLSSRGFGWNGEGDSSLYYIY